MTISTVADGYKALCEAVIKSALHDMRTRGKEYPSRKHKYLACLFFTDEENRDLYTGIAPHMTRDWEKAEDEARKILDSPFAEEFREKRSRK